MQDQESYSTVSQLVHCALACPLFLEVGTAYNYKNCTELTYRGFWM